jgi:hypothetical protein
VNSRGRRICMRIIYGPQREQAKREMEYITAADPTTIAALVEELMWLQKEIECDSCGGPIRERHHDDSKCGGCGLHVCLPCVYAFDHWGNGEHGRGDPQVEIARLRAYLAARNDAQSASRPFGPPAAQERDRKEAEREKAEQNTPPKVDGAQ